MSEFVGVTKTTTSSVTRLGDLLDFCNYLKPLEAINLPKFSTFLGNFCEYVKIYHFCTTFIDILRLFLVTLTTTTTTWTRRRTFLLLSFQQRTRRRRVGLDETFRGTFLKDRKDEKIFERSEFRLF